MAGPLAKRPPADGYRGSLNGFALRSAADGMLLEGCLCPFGEWAEINSIHEGHFFERVRARAFAKTILESRDRMRVLLSHGRDPQIGDKPIGRIVDLHENDRGAHYSVHLFEGLPKLVLEGLRGGQYGCSFRFTVVREDFDPRPARSERNLHGLPERTITELRMREFGPTPWPAYASTTANVRGLTSLDVPSLSRVAVAARRRRLWQLT